MQQPFQTAQNKISVRMKGIDRRFRLMLIALAVITVVWISVIGVFVYSDSQNTERFRRENYDRFAGNQAEFAALLKETDHHVQAFEAAQHSFTFFDESTAQEIMTHLKSDDDPEAANVQGPFALDTIMYKICTRLYILSLADNRFSTLGIYNTAEHLAVIIGNIDSSECFYRSSDAVCEALGISPLFADAPDGSVVAVDPAKNADAVLYVIRRVGKNSILLCGLTEQAVRNTLLLPNFGRSYEIMQIFCDLSNGVRITRNDVINEGVHLIGRVDVNGEKIEVQPEMTIMRVPLDQYEIRLVGVLRETGATSIFASVAFVPLLLINVMWMLVVIACCVYLSQFIFKPLKQICELLPVDQREEGDLKAITHAIGNYQQQQTSNQALIEQQTQQLRRAYLKSLTQGQKLMLTPEQIEEMSIPALLKHYVLVTLYPEDGIWGEEHMSGQEERYFRHVALQIVTEQAAGCLERSDLECLMLESCAILVLPLRTEGEEEMIRSRLEDLIMACRLHIKRKFSCGISKPAEGEDDFENAYYRSIHDTVVSGGKEMDESLDNDLKKRTDLNARICRLIYVEEYLEAWQIFGELMEAIFEIKNKMLRQNRIRAQLDLISCMLQETNAENRRLLSETQPGIYEMVHLEDRQEILKKWQEVFELLEQAKMARLMKEQPHYSSQFESIYQYVAANFRDPNLSLTTLAEMFDMKVPSLSREFQKNLGQGFLEVVHQMRIAAAKEEISNTDATLNDIAVKVGYTNPLTMARAFKKYEGRLPSSFRGEEEET